MFWSWTATRAPLPSFKQKSSKRQPFHAFFKKPQPKVCAHFNQNSFPPSATNAPHALFHPSSDRTAPCDVYSRVHSARLSIQQTSGCFILSVYLCCNQQSMQSVGSATAPPVVSVTLFLDHSLMPNTIFFQDTDWQRGTNVVSVKYWMPEILRRWPAHRSATWWPSLAFLRTHHSGVRPFLAFLVWFISNNITTCV